MQQQDVAVRKKHKRWTDEDAINIHNRVTKAKDEKQDMGAFWMVLADEYGISPAYMQKRYTTFILPKINGAEKVKQPVEAKSLVDAVMILKQERDFYRTELEKVLRENESLKEERELIAQIIGTGEMKGVKSDSNQQSKRRSRKDNNNSQPSSIISGLGKTGTSN